MSEIMSRDIPLKKIVPNPKQPRKHFDEGELQELADNIRLHGQLTPGLVRPVADGFEIVHGERRWRACKLAGLETFRAEVREMDAAQAFTFSLIENIQRDDLTSIEEAQAYRQLADDGKTQAEIGVSIGRTQSYVATKLRLLKLHPGAAYFLAQGLLSEGHGKQLLRLEAMFPKGHENGRLKLGQPGDFEVEQMRAYSVLHHIAPEHGLASWPPGDHDREAVRLLLTGSDNRQWAVASVWWACHANFFEVSIADLNQYLTSWFDRFASAIFRCTDDRHPEPGPLEKMRAWDLIWFAQHSLLTHSNAWDIGEDWISADQHIRLIGMGIPLPAVLCPVPSDDGYDESSFERKSYLAAKEREEAEDDWD